MIENESFILRPEVKTAWINALLSGDYKQGRGTLQTRNKEFCCLGVLCDLYVKEHKTDNWKTTNTVDPYFDDSDYKYEDILPDSVNEWAGLIPEYHLQQLMEMNDDGFSFKEISEYIQEKADEPLA